MDIVPEPRKGGTVIILGAGASYGASLSNRPPIMKNFIKVGKELIKKDYSKLWKFLEHIGYSMSDVEKGSPNLEELYTSLQVISKGLWYSSDTELVKELGKDFWKVLPVDLLESFIVEVVNLASTEAVKNPCRYHNELVKNLIAGDTVLSFNYDLIIDASLKKSNRWFESGGYGYPNFDLLQSHKDHYDFEKISEISLLKLHGSINWKYVKPPLEINVEKKSYGNNSYIPIMRSRTFYERVNHLDAGTQGYIDIKPLHEIDNQAYLGNLAIFNAIFFDEFAKLISNDEMWKIEGAERQLRETFILPPGINKFGNEIIPNHLPEIWSLARKSLSLANEIVAIGYSFPENDIEFWTLFRLSLKNNQNSNLIVKIVNPDQGVAEKIARMIPWAKVVHFASSIKEFAEKL